MLKNAYFVIKTGLQNHIKTLSSQLIDYNRVRFIWALRCMFAAIFSLIISYFYPDAGLWLISSSVFALQIYAYTGDVLSKRKILLWTILLALCSSFIAVASNHTWILWGVIITSIFFAFYYSHRSSEHAIFGVWGAALMIINAFFPILITELPERLVFSLGGVCLAYIILFKNTSEPIRLTGNHFLPNVSKKEYFKYAIKGGIAALLALIAADLLHIQHSYWVLFGAVTVTKLQTDASLRRGTERIYGTLLGVGISLLLALCLLDWPLGIAFVIPLCIFGAVYYFPAYTIAMIFITILFVLTFGVISQQPIEYGIARIIDTSIGVILALVVSYCLWPYKDKK